MSKQIKLEARARVAQILKAALELCGEGAHYVRITRDEIAKKAGIPSSLVAYHCGTMADLRRDIMREAVRVENLAVLAQGLAARDRQALKAPEELRQRAIQSLTV